MALFSNGANEFCHFTLSRFRFFRFTGISPRSITDRHGSASGRSMSGQVVTVHREQPPIRRRSHAMTWRTNDRKTISHRFELVGLTGDRHARPGSRRRRRPCRDGTGSSPSDSPRRQMVCGQGASGARSLSGGRSSLSPVPSSLPSSSRARSGNRRGGGGAGSALDASRLACRPWVV